MDPNVLRVNSEAVKISVDRSLNRASISSCHERSSVVSRHENSPLIRKNLPQTSILIATTHSNDKRTQKALLQEYTCLRSMDQETEVISLKNLEATTVTKQLRNLILELLKLNPQCTIIKDIYEVQSGVYKYMYTSDLKRLKLQEDLSKSLSQVIISGRHKVFLKDFQTPLKPSLPYKSETKSSYHRINLLGPNEAYPIIPLISGSLKAYKTPMIKAKKIPFHNKSSRKFSETERNSENFISTNSLIPYMNGSKVKEGAGGFKKPFLYFPKEKTTMKSQRQMLNEVRSEPKLSKITISPSIFKEILSVDEVCFKYSMTRQEFSSMLSDYTYLKGKNKYIDVETLTNAYSLGPSIFKGIDPKFLYRKILTWEEFLKFYVVVVLKRSSFVESLEFIFNYFGISSLGQIRNLDLPEFESSSRVFNEKIKKLVKAYVESRCDNLLGKETVEMLQKANVTIYDLRILIGMIVSFEN
ncbi:hypothetical protein SteCoe_4770 [Stentor coeruleus]|uniref:Uncharacterized protein n=1 Tax=Stentor coeruleus TaxID=5963 RepID=A0A1R2CTY4_9CILI|nr:hypothetical protein SteCoe_4770 [Stentor coeruleus]